MSKTKANKTLIKNNTKLVKSIDIHECENCGRLYRQSHQCNSKDLEWKNYIKENIEITPIIEFTTISNYYKKEGDKDSWREEANNGFAYRQKADELLEASDILYRAMFVNEYVKYNKSHEEFMNKYKIIKEPELNKIHINEDSTIRWLKGDTLKSTIFMLRALVIENYLKARLLFENDTFDETKIKMSQDFSSHDLQELINLVNNNTSYAKLNLSKFDDILNMLKILFELGRYPTSKSYDSHPNDIYKWSKEHETRFRELCNNITESHRPN